MKILLTLIALLITSPVMAKDLSAVSDVLSSRSILQHGDYFWNDVTDSTEAVHVTVNLTTQMAYVWRGNVLIGATNVSSGRTGFETPVGRFVVLGKEDVHHSKHYDADMPFTMWLNNDGVALHSGGTPGRPSSHGCVHLPSAFAALLYDVVQKGTVVKVTNTSNERLDLTLAYN